MLRRCRRGLIAAFVMGLASTANAEPRFTGTWDTTFGRMHLNQDESQVTGFYAMAGRLARITGAAEKSRWTFRYQEPHDQGEGHFDISADGQTLTGQWRPQGAEAWQPWAGRRVDPLANIGTFAGVWSTSFGKLRLMVNKDAVRGCYAFPAGSTLDGRLTGDKFTFNYREPDAKGAGWFHLAPDGRSFQGQWRPDGAKNWLDWFGTRIEPVPDRSWLVVIEAHWEQDIAEPEYSFGAMLRAFFARSPNVQVRHRFVNDAADLARACQEVTYLTDPVVLVVASHGTGKGVSIGNDTVGAETFVEALRYAPKLKLLHFSSCSVMQGSLPSTIQAGRVATQRFPISGYTQSVDWAASAVLEFLYFDMILSRGLSPARAAEQVRLLMPFAGDAPLEGAAIRPAGFRLLMPQDMDVTTPFQHIGILSLEFHVDKLSRPLL